MGVLQQNEKNPIKQKRNNITIIKKDNLTIKNKAPSATAFILTSRLSGTIK